MNFLCRDKVVLKCLINYPFRRLNFPSSKTTKKEVLKKKRSSNTATSAAKTVFLWHHTKTLPTNVLSTSPHYSTSSTPLSTLINILISTSYQGTSCSGALFGRIQGMACAPQTHHVLDSSGLCVSLHK